MTGAGSASGPAAGVAEGQAIADDIRRQRPGWLVIFGCYSKQFVAFPLFSVSRRTILTAWYPDALIDRMARAEQQRRIRSEGN